MYARRRGVDRWMYGRNRLVYWKIERYVEKTDRHIGKINRHIGKTDRHTGKIHRCIEKTDRYVRKAYGQANYYKGARRATPI
jgi:transposase